MSKTMSIATDRRAKDELKHMVENAEIIHHLDTPNTFAACQIILSDGFEIWLNARNGCIISAGRTINRL